MLPMNELVYSTECGRISPKKPTPELPKTDGIIRITRQISGRKGNGVSIISGFSLNETALKKLAKTLKQHFGCGGTVKNYAIEIQSHKRDELKVFLEKKGFNVKIAGG